MPPTTPSHLFTTHPWQPPTPSLPAWHKLHIPFSNSSNNLQTLNIWLPATSSRTTPPSDSDIPNLPGLWLIFIHGGAWRDPAITSLNFATPTIRHVLSNHSEHSDDDRQLAGIISLSYSLSPKPSVPSLTPEEARSRQAVHPQHILDVLSGLKFAKELFGAAVEGRGILIGHSCGATLALQTIMRSEKAWSGRDERGKVEEKVWQPAGMVLLCGIYDIPLLCKPTTPRFVPYVPIYREFVEGAFGEDESVWRKASPVFHEGFGETWKQEDRLVVLADSAEDGMVPPEQGEEMLKVLVRQGWKMDNEEIGERTKERTVVRVELKDGHDAIWEDGGQIAKVIEDVLKRLQFSIRRVYA